MASTFRFTIHPAESEVYKNSNKRSNTKQRQINNIYQNKGVNENDSTRATTKSRIAKDREAKYRAYTKDRKARDGIYKQLVGNAEALRTNIREYSSEEQQAKQSIIAKIGDIGRIIAKIASKLKIKLDVLKSGEVINTENSDFLQTKRNKKRINK